MGDGPSIGCVGQVPEKTGRDDRMPSILVFDSCRATLENDRTRRQTAVRPRPGSGRTDCSVENTGLDTVRRIHIDGGKLSESIAEGEAE